MNQTTEVINGFFALVLVLIGAYAIHWAASRQSSAGRVRGKLRRWKYAPALVALAVLFGLWKAVETGAIDIASILTTK